MLDQYSCGIDTCSRFLPQNLSSLRQAAAGVGHIGSSHTRAHPDFDEHQDPQKIDDPSKPNVASTLRRRPQSLNQSNAPR